MSPIRQTAIRSAGNSGTATPTSGSQTILQTQPDSSLPSATLRLRAQPEPRRRIQWAEDVVDNEGMGKKSSKVCCIYHKPHEPGESDSESSSSSSDDDSDSEPDLSRAQKAGGKGKRDHKGHHHDEAECNRGGGGTGGQGKGKARRPSPNAYERQPKYKTKSDA